MPNNPIHDEQLAELDRLHEAAIKGMNWQEVAQFQAMITEQYQPMRQRLTDAKSRLAEAERDRDVYHAALSEIYYRAIPLNEDSGHSTIAHIAADAMRGNNGNPFAARDARMKREGAVEAYERAADMLSVFPGGADAEEMMRDAAKRLREGK